MKKTSLLLGLCAAGLLGSSGCKKAEPPTPVGTVELFGVKVELPKVDKEFENASPELQSAVREIDNDFRERRLAKMVVDLDKLGSSANLTDSQKKAINDVLDQVKQVLAKNPPLPPQ